MRSATWSRARPARARSRSARACWANPSRSRSGTPAAASRSKCARASSSHFLRPRKSAGARGRDSRSRARWSWTSTAARCTSKPKPARARRSSSGCRSPASRRLRPPPELEDDEPMKLAKVSTSHIKAVTGTTFVATLSSLLFGYATAVIAGVVGAIDHNFIAPRGLSNTAADALLGLTVCSALVGTVIGAVIARPMAFLLGRKRPMILAAILFVVSAVGSAYPELLLAPIGHMGPDAIWPFNFYRMLGGIAVGVASMIAPLYVGEFAPSAVRGQLGAYQQIAITGGMTIAYFVNWGIALQGDDVWVLETGWRWMMLSLSIPAMAFFYLSFSVPESPSWLVKKGRIDQATKQLRRSAEAAEVESMLSELAAEHPDEKPAPLFTFGRRVV